MNLNAVTVEEIEKALVQNNYNLSHGTQPDFTDKIKGWHKRLEDNFNRFAAICPFNIVHIKADDGYNIDYNHRGQVVCQAVAVQIANRPANDKAKSFRLTIQFNSRIGDITLYDYNRCEVKEVTGNVTEDIYSVMSFKKYGAKKASSRHTVYWNDPEAFFNNLPALCKELQKKWEKAARENDIKLKNHQKGVITKELVTDEISELTDMLNDAIRSQFDDERVHFEFRTGSEDTAQSWQIYLTNHNAPESCYYSNHAALLNEFKWQNNRAYMRNRQVPDAQINEALGAEPPANLHMLVQFNRDTNAPLWRIRRMPDTTFTVEFPEANQLCYAVEELFGNTKGFQRLSHIDHLENIDACYVWILRCITFLQNMDRTFIALKEQARLLADRF